MTSLKAGEVIFKTCVEFIIEKKKFGFVQSNFIQRFFSPFIFSIYKIPCMRRCQYLHSEIKIILFIFKKWK